MADDIERDKPRRRRIALWIALSAVAVIGAVAFYAVRHTYQSSGAFRVGTCFLVNDDTSISEAAGLREVSGRAKVVSCGTAHDAEITRTARHPSGCSPEGAWLNSRDQIYCVTVSR
ncbi:hypothetical protein FHG89_10135 [Micromonospora orduensis]|uniref:Uncharacterized protein n=1 Tax=Micromonospora orduensis TaxID=1420891 RepID=A0A5C4QUS5_9ACTN|nr:hypothetical protein [Micromonospora orduensis]TNH29933.1 hypothetical protein FHG89_10135 [Micromonospora orduensis]